jgi:hypothetical protein
VTRSEINDAVVETLTTVREMNERSKDHDRRLSEVERKQNKASGAVAVLQWIVGALGLTEGGHIWWKH